MQERSIHISSLNRVKVGTSQEDNFTVPFDPALNLQSWTKVLGHLHFFAENRPSSISPSPLPLSMLYQWAESALFRSNIDQGGGGTSLCANATLQSVENRAISEHVSYFQAVPRTFVQDCLNSLCGSKNDNNSNGVQHIATKFGQQSV